MQVPDQAYNDLQQTAVLNQNRDALIRHQLKLRRRVFSNCPKTAVALSICRARGSENTSAKPFCLEDYPSYPKVLTGIGLKSEWKFFLLSLPIFANVPLRDVSENSQNST